MQTKYFRHICKQDFWVLVLMQNQPHLLQLLMAPFILKQELLVLIAKLI